MSNLKNRFDQLKPVLVSPLNCGSANPIQPSCRLDGAAYIRGNGTGLSGASNPKAAPHPWSAWANLARLLANVRFEPKSATDCLPSRRLQDDQLLDGTAFKSFSVVLFHTVQRATCCNAGQNGNNRFMQSEKDKLKSLYLDHGLTIRQVAQEMEMSPTTLRRRMKAYGIERRMPGPEHETWWQTEDYLRSKYEGEGLSTIAIAELVHSTPSTVNTWLEKLGISRRGQGSHWKGQKLPESARRKMSAAKKGRYLGVDNPNWKGGKITEEVRERRSYIAKKWRETVLQRDHFICQKCGSRKRLHVHHILSFAEHPKHRWDINNGLTVCASCHEAIHGRSFPDWVSGREPTNDTPIDEVKITKQRRFEISEEKLEHLYFELGSCRKVAFSLGFSEETIRKKLIEFGIVRHKVGGRRRFKISRERLKELYQNHSMREIAIMLGVGETVVWKRINEFGIKKEM